MKFCKIFKLNSEISVSDLENLSKIKIEND